MQKVSICHECGRTIDSEFSFCPWCGASMTGEIPLEAAFDEVFSKIETKRESRTVSRIAKMEDELGALDKDLSLFLSGTAT